MAGKALQPVLLPLPSDIGRAVQGAVDMAAPAVVDLYPAQLREHALQVGPGGCRHVLGDAAQVGAAAAEQQAVVRSDAEVVGDELVVDGAGAAREQRARQLRVQRRGGHLVGADRQQAFRQLAVEAVDIGVAGQHQDVAAHLAVLSAHAVAVGGLLPVQRLALLEDASSGCLDGAGQALGQLQRVEVGGAGVEQRGQVARAGDPLRQLFFGDEAQLRIAVLLLGFLQALLQLAHAARQHGGVQRAGAVVDVEAVAAGQLAHLLGGPDHAVPQALGAFQAQSLFQRRHVAGPARQGLAAVAPGSGPGDAAGFQQHHLLAGQGQAQAGVQAAEAAADDDHVAVERFLQARAQGDLAIGGGVVGADVLRGLLEHGSLVKFIVLYFMKKYTIKFTRPRPVGQYFAQSRSPRHSPR